MFCIIITILGYIYFPFAKKLLYNAVPNMHRGFVGK